MSLPKKQKVDTPLFDLIYKQGKTFHSKNVFLKVLKREKPHILSRFSIVIPKKTAKKVVDRNKIKRKIGVILNTYKKSFVSGFAGVFFVKPSNSLDFLEEVREDVVFLLEKAQLLKKSSE